MGGNVGIGTTSPRVILDVQGGDIYLGESTGAASRALRFYQGPGGTAGHYSTIRADDDQLYISNADGGVYIEQATNSSHALMIQEADSPWATVKWWFDGSSATGTGMWFQSPASAGSMNFQLGDAAGVSLFKVNDSNNKNLFNVTSAGNVGIGTTVPEYKLDIAGSTNVRGDFYIWQDPVLNVNGSVLEVNNNADYTTLSFNTSSAEQMRITSTGNVGIGTTQPGYKLDVNGDVRVASGSDFYVNTIGLNDNGSTSSGASLIGLYDDSMTNISGNTTVQSAIKQLDTAITSASSGGVTSLASSNSSLTFSASVGTVDAVLNLGHSNTWTADQSFTTNTFFPSGIFNSTGNVGIGTTTPGARLAVMGGNVGIGTTVAANKLTIAQSADSNGIKLSGYDDLSASNVTLSIDDYGHTRINASGILGLNSGSSIVMQQETNILDNYTYGFGTDADYSLVYNSSTDNLEFNDGNSTGTNVRMVLNSSGYLGIGTTTPGAKLAVMGGNVGIGTTVASYALDVNGDVRVASGSDFYVNTIGLNDNGSTSSGASLIGLYDDSMTNISANTTVQSAIKQLDTAIAAASSGGVTSIASSNSSLTFSASVGTVDAVLNLGHSNTWTAAQTFTANTFFPSGIFNSANNVGIGTTTPGARLAVMGGSVGIGTTNPGLGWGDTKLHLYSDQAYPFMVFEGTYNGSDDLTLLFKKSYAGANIGDWNDIGYIRFNSPNDNSENIDYASIIGNTSDVSDGSEVGSLDFKTYANGGSNSMLGLNSIEITFNNDSLNTDFRVESDNSEAAFFIEGNNGNVGIGTTQPGYKLDVNGDVRVASGSDFYVNTIGLNDNGSTSSGASLIGLYDDSMTNISGNTTVQSAIKQLDTAITSASSGGVTSIGSSNSSLTFSASVGTIDAVFNLGHSNTWTADQSFTTNTFFPSGIWNSTGNVGIGTTTPSYKLTVSGDIYSEQGWNTGSEIGTLNPGSDDNTIFLWNANKGAFRAGEWDMTIDNADIGYSSVSFGYDTLATGYASLASGNDTIASGDYSATFGNDTVASGPQSVAFGNNTVSSGQSSIAFGDTTEASGQQSAAYGSGTVASGDNSAAYGSGTVASGDQSIAFGGSTTASNYNAAAFGYLSGALGNSSAAFGYSTTAAGDNSVAFGYGSVAQSYSSLAIGRYNVGGGTTGSWVATDPLFEIGIGANAGSRANALTVLKNGNVGIGTTNPATMLEVYNPNAATNNIRFTGAESESVSLQLYSDQGDDDQDKWAINNIASDNSLRFANDGGNHLVLLSGGNVGIGTTQPGYKLDVNGDVRVASGSDFYVNTIGLNDNGSTSSGASLIGLYDDSMTNISANTTVQSAIKQLDTAIAAASSGGVTSIASSNSSLTFSASVGTVDAVLNLGHSNTWTAAQTFTANTFFPGTGIWDTNGNIGIGTTAPTAKLSIGGASSVISNASGNLTLAPASNLIVSQGNVGIGTTQPGYKLDVNGDVRVASGSDFYVNTIGLNDNGSTSSGASLIGLYDDSMTNISANTTVQSAIKQLDTAIAAASSGGVTSIASSNSSLTFSASVGTVDAVLNLGHSNTWTAAQTFTANTFFPSGIFNSANNVGIGTTTPGARLAVMGGNVGIGTTVGSQALDVAGSIELANYLYFGNATTEYLRWDGSDFILSDELLPSAADTNNLGSASAEWNSLYVADGSGATAGGGMFLGSDQDFLLTYDETTSDALELSDGTNTFLSVKDQGTAADFAFNSIALFINNGGNVGIGTSEPGSLLNLSSTGDAELIIGADSDNSGEDDNPSIRFKQDGTSYGLQIGLAGNSDAPYTGAISNSPYIAALNENPLQFAVSATGSISGAATKMIIQSDGNVGIGTTAPTSKLSIGGASSVISNGSGNLTLTPAANLVVSQGNVGIGTTNPTSKLHIVGTTQITDGVAGADTAAYGTFGVTRDDSANTLSYINMTRESNVVKSMGIDSSNRWVFGLPSSSSVVATPQLVIEQGGNVGVGTTVATQKLTVAGRIVMDTWTADGDTVAYRDTATNSIALATSDQRLKKNLEPLTGAMDIIMQLNSYKYNDLDEEDGTKKKLGLMSQEVLPLIPELTFKFTKEGSDEEYFGVHYDKLTALLMEGIKEQQLEIATTTSNLSNLNSVVNLSDTGSIAVSSTTYSGVLADATPNMLESLAYEVRDSAGQVVNRIGVFKQIMVGGVKASYADIKNLVVDTAIVRQVKIGEQLIVNGVNVGDKLSELQQQLAQAGTQTESVIPSEVEGSLSVSGTLSTGILSPIPNEDIVIDLTASESATRNSSLVIRNSDSTVASIDSTGKASLADLLISNNATVSGNLAVSGSASVSGTLYADSARFKTLEAEQIKARSIEGLEAKIGEMVAASFSAQQLALKPNAEPSTATTSAQPSWQEELDNLIARLNLTDTASASGTWNTNADLAYDSQLNTQNIDAETGIFNTFLAVTGTASIVNLEATNSLVVNDTLHADANSLSVINGLDDTLYLQKTGLGKVDILAGAVTIEANGNMHVNGDLYLSGSLYAQAVTTQDLTAQTATVSGSLFASLIRPGEGDLTLDLTSVIPSEVEGSSEASASAKKFNVANHGNVVASIDASGSASFANVTTGKLNLPAQPDSGEANPEELSAIAKSVGTAMINTHETFVTVQAPAVTEDSLIFVTPTTTTTTPIAVTNKTAGESFTVSTSTPTSQNIRFNWWIVN